MKKTVLGIAVCLLFVTLAGCGSKKGDNFPTWTEDAAAIQALESYVETVTDEKSEDFIPVEDRIAAFDLDGTLYGETFPIYGEWLMFAERALNDPTYDAPEDIREVAETVVAAGESRSIPDGLEEAEIKAQAKAFAGMSIEDYTAYVEQFMETDAEGFDNLKRGDAFYLPMLEIVTYLQENDFMVYICSGTNRFTVRALIDGTLDIPERQVIGTDFTMTATGQGETGDMHYNITAEDEVLMGDELIIKNVKTSKVFQIMQELGKNRSWYSATAPEISQWHFFPIRKTRTRRKFSSFFAMIQSGSTGMRKRRTRFVMPVGNTDGIRFPCGMTGLQFMGMRLVLLSKKERV